MSAKLPWITAADLLRALHRDGWYEVRQKGSHVVLKHPAKPGRVVVPCHAGVALAPKTLQDALDQAGLTVDELIDLL
ncbi:MAG: type II toxin-antitoxin system HicA family toxin [Chloroflexi bacterium]|nr:type II toxin-antitoxin system HicA family toxin [Chloroflexota bacterium]